MCVACVQHIALVHPHGNRAAGPRELKHRRVAWVRCDGAAVRLLARAGRQHTVKGSHKKNDLNAVASKCINLEFFCVNVNGRPANDQ